MKVNSIKKRAKKVPLAIKIYVDLQYILIKEKNDGAEESPMTNCNNQK